MATVDERSDRDLLHELALDDRFALAELYRHSPWLLARLSRQCADPDMVDQAQQDTLSRSGASRLLQGLRRGGGLDVGYRHSSAHRPAPAPARGPSSA